MKTILWIATILAATAISSMAAQFCDSTCMDSKISQMKEDLQIQLERIRRARDTADSKMTLAKLRIAEQLRRSEDDLTGQIERLERYREQLTDQRSGNGQVASEMQQDWTRYVADAASNLHHQLQQTNDLIARMESLRDKFDVDPNGLTPPNTGHTMPSAPSILQTPVPAGSSTTGSQSRPPTITLTATVNLRSGTSTATTPTPANAASP